MEDYGDTRWTVMREKTRDKYVGPYREGRYTNLFQAQVKACNVAEEHDVNAWVIEHNAVDYECKEGKIVYKISPGY